MNEEDAKLYKAYTETSLEIENILKQKVDMAEAFKDLLKPLRHKLADLEVQLSQKNLCAKPLDKHLGRPLDFGDQEDL